MRRSVPQFLVLGAAALILAIAAAPRPAAAGQTARSGLSAFAGLWSSAPGGRARRPDGAPAPGQGQGERRGPPPGVEAAQAPAEIAHITGLDRADLRTFSMMTEAGRAAFAAMDPADLPVNNCLSAGLPHIAGAPGLQEWIVEGGVLTIRHEFSSAVRTIDLTRARHADGAPTPQGDAIAWMDGDTLVIETANLAATPGGLARNAPASDSRVVTERYAPGPGGGLIGEMTISDPAFLTRDVTMPIRLAAAEPGAELVFYPCSVENARRYLE